MSVFQAFLCTLFCCTSLFKCSCRNIYADIYIFIACVCVRVCMRDVCRTAPKSQISHESSRKFASFIWPRISVCSLVCHIFAYPVTMQYRQEGVLLITQTKSPKTRTFGRHLSRFLYFQIVLIKYYGSLTHSGHTDKASSISLLNIIQNCLTTYRVSASTSHV